MTKQSVRALLTQQVGKQVADALLNKVDKMAKQGASAEKIEQAFFTDLHRALEKRVSKLIGTSVQSLAGVQRLVAVQSKK